MRRVTASTMLTGREHNKLYEMILSLAKKDHAVGQLLERESTPSSGGPNRILPPSDRHSTCLWRKTLRDLAPPMVRAV